MPLARLLAVVLAVWSLACGSLPVWATPAGIADSACVQQYDPTRDYFPDKARLLHARGFTIEYFGHYKVLTVPSSWPAESQSFRYLLVQCGTPVPDGYADAQLIYIPVKRVIVLSKPPLSHLELLDELGSLLALDSLDRVYSPTVRRMIAAGEVSAVGWSATIDVERILALNPDMVMATAYNQPQHNVHPLLQRVGIPVVVHTGYAEPSPLGQAEWLQFTAAFFNKEGLAQRLIEALTARYQTLAALTRDIPEDRRPSVLTGALFGDTWYVPSSTSTLAQLLKTAGATYPWADTEAVGNRPLDFEAVFASTWSADYWLTAKNEWLTRADMLAADARYGQFQAFQKGRVFNNNARLSEQGGNDYWERGVMEPDVVLADLIKIFHPELLPEHTLKYFRPLP